jgi:4-alpha-glucanotransferase
MAAASHQADLARLAAFLGIQRSYTDATGVRRHASTDAIAATIEALLRRPLGDPSATLGLLRRERSSQLAEPAAAIWLPGRRVLCLNASVLAGASLECVLEGSGRERRWSVPSRGLEVDRRGALLPLPHLEPGYHTLHLTARWPGRSPQRASTLLIAAPRRAYAGTDRAWGVFVPLYALHSSRSWGIGDFSDLAEFGRWARGLGADGAGLLPLLAAFLDSDGVFDPSPYAPASRLMWNEAFIDVEALPEIATNASARELIASPAFKHELAAVRASSLVDYARVAGLKASVLRKLGASLTASREREMAAFLDSRPEVAGYARFRARTAAHGRHDSGATEPAFDHEVAAYHRYSQFAAETQLAEAAGPPSEAGLYLDLPLGVHAAGYDVWRWPECFVLDASTGAPPDPLALGGQDWGFPPPHPEGIREQRYEYVIAYLRHSMRYASRLRIDHVMGLHRLFVIPRGLPASEGVYVRYPADELYAILCLESHLQRCELIGENLGTVPAYVNPTLDRHDISGTYVVPFEVRPDADPPLRPPRRDEAAALNTHDLLPFASWWTESGWAHQPLTAFLAREGLLAPDTGGDPAAVRDALLAHLGRSDARFVLAALEDLWLETHRQNVPGLNDEPNWRHKARHSLEAVQSLAEVSRSLTSLDAARRIHDASRRDAAGESS